MSLHLKVNEKDQKQGSPDALITLIEYGDYECPHCGAAYPIIKKLQKHFGDKLLFVYRNFPLSEIHPHALNAAYVAQAAGAQKIFWPVHDLIFENQENLSTRDLLDYAKTAGADIKLLMVDMNTPYIISKVAADLESGIRNGVNGTPTFFINGKRYNNSYDFVTLIDTIEGLL